MTAPPFLTRCERLSVEAVLRAAGFEEWWPGHWVLRAPNGGVHTAVDLRDVFRSPWPDDLEPDSDAASAAAGLDLDLAALVRSTACFVAVCAREGGANMDALEARAAAAAERAAGADNHPFVAAAVHGVREAI